MNRLTVTVAEAAAVLGVSRQAIYDAIGRGEIRMIRIGRRQMIPRVALEELVGQPIDVPA